VTFDQGGVRCDVFEKQDLDAHRDPSCRTDDHRGGGILGVPLPTGRKGGTQYSTRCREPQAADCKGPGFPLAHAPTERGGAPIRNRTSGDGR
jgi:hypothetical protein